MRLTNPQIAQEHMMNTYPCLQAWLDFIYNAVPNTLNYDTISCAQLAIISRATMKTLDYIVLYDPNSSIVRVSKMLFEMHDTAWRCWTAFTAQSRITTGSQSISLTPTVLQAISTFDAWDIALVPSPTFFDPPTLLNTILQGVTT